MRRLVEASRVRIPAPVRSRPRWSRRIPTRIAHGIGHDHAWVFMDSIGNKAVNPKLAESAPDAMNLYYPVAPPSEIRHLPKHPRAEAEPGLQDEAGPRQSPRQMTEGSVAGNCFRRMVGSSVNRASLKSSTLFVRGRASICRHNVAVPDLCATTSARNVLRSEWSPRGGTPGCRGFAGSDAWTAGGADQMRAARHDVALPTAGVMVSPYPTVIDMGFGDEPKSTMVKVYEKRSDQKVRGRS